MGLKDELHKTLLNAHEPGDPIRSIIEQNFTHEFMLAFVTQLLEERKRTFAKIQFLRAQLELFGVKEDE